MNLCLYGVAGRHQRERRLSKQLRLSTVVEVIGGPDDPEMCVNCFRYVPLGERCEGCGEYVVDFSESGPENATFRQCERHGVWLVNGAPCETCAQAASVTPPVPGWALNGIYGSAFVNWAEHDRRPNEFLLEALPPFPKTLRKVIEKIEKGRLRSHLNTCFISPRGNEVSRH